MTTTQEIFWWTVMFAGLAGSALYSGAETGFYCLNKVRLHLLEHQNDHQAHTLTRLTRHPTRLLATLLIGTNLGNYLGTTAVAVLLQKLALSDWQLIVANALIVTPLLFIFVETLPKDLFAAHSDTFIYRIAKIIELSKKLFTATGLVHFITLTGSLMMRLLGHKGESRLASDFKQQRLMVEQLMREGVGHGLLSDEQSAIVERVLDLSSRTLEDEMTRWKNVITVNVDQPPDILWQLADRTHHSRFPVVDKQGKVVGRVSIYAALLHEKQTCPPIRELMTPALRLDVHTPLRDALARLQAERTSAAIVMHHDRPTGLVSIKDLVEPITGELASW